MFIKNILSKASENDSIPFLEKATHEAIDVLINAADLCHRIWKTKNRFSEHQTVFDNSNIADFTKEITQSFTDEYNCLIGLLSTSFNKKKAHELSHLVDEVDKKSIATKAVLAYVLYAIQQTAYAFHDAIHLKINNFDLQKVLNDSEAIKLIIISDYLIRSRSIFYIDACNNAILPDSTYKKPDNYFLVCGAFRLTSALACDGKSYVPPENKAYKLSEKQSSDYKFFLEAERGRYQVLLRRLLLCTNYYEVYSDDKLSDNMKRLLIESGEKTLDKVFLEYDNITNSQIEMLSAKASNESCL